MPYFGNHMGGEFHDASTSHVTQNTSGIAHHILHKTHQTFKNPQVLHNIQYLLTTLLMPTASTWYQLITGLQITFHYTAHITQYILHIVHHTSHITLHNFQISQVVYKKIIVLMAILSPSNRSKLNQKSVNNYFVEEE